MIRIGGQNQCIGTIYYLCLTLNNVGKLLLVVGLWNHFARSGRKEARWRNVTCGNATADVTRIWPLHVVLQPWVVL